MPRLKSANNAESTLVAGIAPSDLSFQVADASPFPDAPFRITINGEIMEVGNINKATNTFSSVLRAQEGTVAANHLSGDSVQNRFTAGTYNELANDLDLQSHISNTNNPHNVTAEQLGALPTTGGTINGDLTVFGGRIYVGAAGSGIYFDSERPDMSRIFWNASPSSNFGMRFDVDGNELLVLDNNLSVLSSPLRIFGESNALQIRYPGNSGLVQFYNTNNNKQMAYMGIPENSNTLRFWAADNITFYPTQDNFSGAFSFTNNPSAGITYGTFSRLRFAIGALQARNVADSAFIPILASAFNVNSERQSKTDIEQIKCKALEKILNTSVYQYHVKDQKIDYQRIGLMAEEAPEEILERDKKAVDLYSMISLGWKAIQELHEKINTLGKEKIQ